MAGDSSDVLVPRAQQAMENLKRQVASRVGIVPAGAGPSAYQQALDRLKFEVARELGIPLQPGYNGDLRTRLAGKIGGHMGGRIGGQMVRELITRAEQSL